MSRDISKANIRLQAVHAYVQENWPKRYPKDPVPFLTEVDRSDDEQRAYYAQGREKVANVNSLRRKAGLSPISEQENRKAITNAKVGQSKHSRKPSEAVDYWFAVNGKLVDNARLWKQLVKLVKEADPAIKWGGEFSFVDKPHFEI